MMVFLCAVFLTPEMHCLIGKYALHDRKVFFRTEGFVYYEKVGLLQKYSLYNFIVRYSFIIQAVMEILNKKENRLLYNMPELLY